MNVTLKLTLDGLIEALRWRQFDLLENPQNAIEGIRQRSSAVPRDKASMKTGEGDGQ